LTSILGVRSRAALTCINMSSRGNAVNAGSVVVGDDADGGALEVLELPALDGDPQHDPDDERDGEAQRHQEEEDLHG